MNPGMMMRIRTLKTLLSMALTCGLLAGLAGCKQTEGDRCQIDDDCEAGLYCELAGNTRAAGGFCKSTAVTVTPAADLSTKPADMSAVDM